MVHIISSFQLWQFVTNGPIFSSPCVVLDLYPKISHLNNTENPQEILVLNNGVILIGSHDCQIYCLTTQGQLMWTHKMPSEVYATCFTSQFHSKLLKKTEMVKQKTESESDVSSKFFDFSETWFNNVIACSTNGYLQILDINNGGLHLSTVLPHEIFSSPIVYDGNIVVGCRDDNVYCYNIK